MFSACCRRCRRQSLEEGAEYDRANDVEVEKLAARLEAEESTATATPTTATPNVDASHTTSGVSELFLHAMLGMRLLMNSF